MNHKEDIHEEVERTLRSLDGVKRAEVNPFLFTRIMAKMQKQNGWEKVTSFLTRPVIAIAILAMVIAVNAFALFGTAGSTTSETDSIAASDISGDYAIAATTNYDYENIENE